MLKILPIILFLAGCLMAGDGVEYYEIIDNSSCCYHGKSYVVPCSVEGNCPNATYGYRYDYGDSIPCPYDSEKLRKELTPYIYSWLNDLPENERERDKLFYANTIKIRAYHEFPNSPDFVLLRYHIQMGSYNAFFVGLVKSTGRWYILTDGYGGTLMNNYNRMIEENGDVLNISPICKAMLLIRLKYNLGPVFFPISDEELLVAFHFRYYFEQNDEEFPVEEFPFDILYFNDISENRIIQEHLPNCRLDTMAVDHSPDDPDEYISWIDSPIKDSVNYSPPKKIYKQDTFEVKLSSFRNYFWYSEHARWRVVFGKNGTILKIDYTEKPIFGMGSPIDPDFLDVGPFFQDTMDDLWTFRMMNEKQDAIIKLQNKKEKCNIRVNCENFAISIGKNRFFSEFNEYCEVPGENIGPYYDSIIHVLKSDTLTEFIDLMSIIKGWNMFSPFFWRFYDLIQAGEASILDKSKDKWLDFVRIRDYEYGEEILYTLYSPDNRLIITFPYGWVTSSGLNLFLHRAH